MDYDWKYYLEDLKAGKSKVIITDADRRMAGYIMKRFPKEQRRQKAAAVRDMLHGYRQRGKAENALIEEAVRCHTEYCSGKEDDELLKRRHNVVVYRYMMKTARHNKAVAAKIGVCRETVINDIRQAVDELLVILFGIPAVGDSPQVWPEAVRSLFENMRLMKYTLAVSQHFVYQKWEQERSFCVEITDGILQSIEKAVQLYEEYCSCCLTTEDTAKRSLEIIRALYLGNGNSTIQRIVDCQEISKETVYADVKKATGHFAELLEYMASLPERQREVQNFLKF